jgi:hypothetical protein
LLEIVIFRDIHLEEEPSYLQKKAKREPDTIRLHGKMEFRKGIIKTDNSAQTEFYIKRK